MGMSSTPPASASPQRPRTDGMRARRKLRRTDRERRRSRRARTVLASGLALAVLFGAAAVVAPRPRLPRPTGPYAIGTTVRTWTDDSRPEPFTADPDDHRSVVAQIWYPAAPGPESEDRKSTRLNSSHVA